jgi:hypothetical protein
MLDEEFDPASAKNDQLVPRIVIGPLRSFPREHRIAGCQSIDGSENRNWFSTERNKEEELSLMDLSLWYHPEALGKQKTKTGHHQWHPASVWSLGRRSGCFPALPYPPPKPVEL